MNVKSFVLLKPFTNYMDDILTGKIFQFNDLRFIKNYNIM